MIFLKSTTNKLLLILSILLGVIVLGHILITLILNNVMFYSDLTLYTLVLISTSLVGTFIAQIILAIKRSNSLYKGLIQEADPKRVLEIINSIEEEVLGKKSKINLIIVKVTTLFRLAQFQEANNLLKSKIENITNNKMQIILWKHNQIMTSIPIRNEIEELQKEYLNLINQYNKKSTIIKMYHEAQLMYYELYNYNFDKAEQYYKNEISFCIYETEKVSYYNNLSKIYYYKKKYEEAIKACEFVIKYGNTMFAVEECKNLLIKIGENQ